MRWVLVAAFLGLAASSQITDWSLEKEYIFHYTTTVLSGIPELGRQYAGLKLSTKLKAQKFSDQTVRIKFEDSKFLNYNEVVEKDSRFPHAPRRDDEDHHEVPASIKHHLEMAFKVVTHEGLLQKIQCEAVEPEYITNIKKAAVSQLLAVSQTKLAQHSGTDFVTSLLKSEESSVGQCDTRYTVERMSEDMARQFEEREQIPMRELCQNKAYYEVVKTKDLKNCKERPVYVHMYGARSVSDGSLGSSAPFVTEASVTRSVICGNPNSIVMRVTSNQHKIVISPTGKFENKEMMEIASSSIMSLHSVQDKQQDIPDVKAPKPRGSLMFEHPNEDSFSGKVSSKSLISDLGANNKDWYQPQILKPSLDSKTNILFPTDQNLDEDMKELSLTFLNIMDIARQSPESSYSREDVAGLAVMFSRALVKLGLQDIQSLWQQIEPRVPAQLKESAYYTYLDLVSICGTNPTIKYIIEEVKSGKLIGENVAMIVSNAIRSTKTPTKDLIKEMIDFLKNIADQDNQSMVSTVALAVTHLIHKACVHETSSVSDYPAKTFGRFCDGKSPEITTDLIPFLSTKLFAARKSDTNKILTYTNALGNLGHDGAAVHLLKVIDDVSFDVHLRSVAVYQLIKTASVNPVLYRPIILQLIENVAESDSVRMAAITVLPYTRPSSIYLNKLAIRTWWEPSHQVCAYITSILKTLADPEVARFSKIHSGVFEPAKEALRMAKPTVTGIQNSHEIIISQFLDTLQAGVNMKMQYVISEESQWPRNVYMKTSIRGKAHIVNALEAAVHMEGAPFLINKLYEIYSTFLPEAEQERMDKNKDYIKTIINVESRRMKRPEAHITIKSMGLQRIFSIDSTMVEELIEKVAIGSIDALRTHKRHSYDFLKIADLNGHNAIIPTESGLPVYMSHQTPLVVSGKANTEIVLQNLKNVKAGITIKPVINYKQIVEAGIYCPFTKRFLGTGVDSAIHFALPLATEVAFKDGQFSINIKTPEDQESQKEKPLVEIRVKPYTSNYDITSSSLVPLSKSADSKIIRSNSPLKVKDVNIGDALGLALNLKVETEQPFIDVAEIIHQLSLHKPLTLLTLPFPLHTVRHHSIKVMYNPQTSITKEASFSMLSSRALRQSSSDIPLITTYSDEKMNQTIVDVCKQQIIDWKTQQDESIKKELEEHLERCILSKPRAECETEMELRHQEDADEREVKCIIEENSKLEMAKCVEERGIQSRPSSEIHSYCTKKILLYKQKHSAINDIKKWTNIGLSEIQGPSRATTVHMQANLHGTNHAVVKGVAAFGMVGKDNENTMVKVLAGVKTHHIRTPYIFAITGIRNSKMPTNIWDKEAMLTEDLTSTIRIQAVGGTRFTKLFDSELDIITERSEEMKAHAKNSESWKLCEADSSKELRLSSQCRKARILASSLDVIKMELSLPKALTKNPHIVTLTNALKAYYLPYLTFQDSRYNRQGRNNDYFQILAKVSPDSKSLSFGVAAEAKSTVFNNLRLAPFMKYFLPVCSKNSFPLRLVNMITDSQRPARCSIEGNKVSTFDNLIYDYTFNDCEHVIFRDCTDSPNVMVSVKKTSTQHIVKAVIDGEMYELTINKGSRGSRTNPGQVKINGQVKQPSVKKEGEAITFQDTWNQISLYDDGVYEIFSFKYGLTIRADGKSAEVKSWSHKLRNLACGLCGDLNDEKTGDVLSSQQCVMSSPKLAAYSYMVTNGQCSGIPTQDKAAYQEETKQCIKKTTVPSNVYDIFIQRQLDTKTNQVLMKHLVLERGQNICISVKQVEVCPITSSPAEVVPTDISFFCVSKDQDGSTLKAIALSGERINQADRFPIAFTSTVQTPNRC